MHFYTLITVTTTLAIAMCASGAENPAIKSSSIAPGVICLSAGTPDTYTPYSVMKPEAKVHAMQSLPAGNLPFDINDVSIAVTDRGCAVEVPLADGEQLYGFGLQFDTFGQRGLRKTPRVNDNPLNGLGYSHAPQPMYVSTNGYAIVVNTARNTTFLCGSHNRRNNASAAASGAMASDTNELYRNRSSSDRVYIDIPGARGIDIFIIEGTDMLSAVQRYNLLSGGGALPPMWGLGFKYRVKGDAVQDSVLRFAGYFREKDIPCDVLGLEPGWQTAAYSCSYRWSDERFPHHKAMLDSLTAQGYHINLWEHAYVHPDSPIRSALEPYSGDFLVWNGLVPDFLMPEACDIFSAYHASLADEGISGFKLDECDNSNIAFASATWCFPDMASFPSGIDGEQMHQLFGSLYLRTMDNIYRQRDTRTYQDYRSSGLFMSPYNAVLYSDTYDHREYIRALCNSAFGGLLWCPEVREANSPEEFFHRLQTAVLSPQAMVNAWYLQYPPWLQFDRYRNEQGDFLKEADEYEHHARTLINLRMQLVPYLYQAFHDYHTSGIPPFRPLVMDNPDDMTAREICDQFMIGQWLMAAPLCSRESSREVYFPAGTWYDFNTNQKYEGNRFHTITTGLDQLPLYVRQGALLPLAAPTPHFTSQSYIELTCKVYGSPAASCVLIEDDGTSYSYLDGKANTVTLTAVKNKVKLSRQGNCPHRYRIKGHEFIDVP